jgi:Predicted nucleoside-diphosphate-sugar epimerases
MKIVTGAFGYIGNYITQYLLNQGEEVTTVTTHVDKPNPFGNIVKPHKYDFDNPEMLINHLKGADTLFNTYWIRFPFDGHTFESAVRDTEILFSAAKSAGIKKIVQISVTNASIDSPLPYYRGKAEQERLLENVGIDYSIVRPTLVFGKEDILVNNIGWLIRHFPLFPIFGDGKYRVQPVNVKDLARIAVEASRLPNNSVVDAIGPESFTFAQFVSLIIRTLNSRCIPLKISPSLGINIGKLIGSVIGDVLLTDDELRGLMDNLLTSSQRPNGVIKFSEWLIENRDLLGSTYSSEIKRHFRWRRAS